MLVTIIRKYANASVCDFTSSHFDDVDSEAYYAPYVAWATDLNIIRGTGNNMFSSNNPITREQAAVMLMNFVNNTGIELSKVERNIASFSDVDQINYI